MSTIRVNTIQDTGTNTAATINGGTISFNNAPNGLIKLHSTWVLNPQISSPSDAYERFKWSKDAESTTNNLIGTDITIDSNGKISFPSTGLYKLTIDMQGRHSSSNVTYVGFTWQHSSDSGNSDSTVWRRLGSVIAGGYFYFMTDFYYNVTNTTTQRLHANLYATALSGLVIDGGQGYTSTRLYVTKIN